MGTSVNAPLTLFVGLAAGQFEILNSDAATHCLCKKIIPLNALFTPYQLDFALWKLCLERASVADLLSNQVLQNMVVHQVVHLLKLGKPPSSLNSYRPITRTSCAIKLLKQTMLRRLISFPENNTYMALEMTGFRTHLSAQSFALDFPSGAKLQLGGGHCILPTLLYVQVFYGVIGGITSNFANCLTRQTLNVKFGNILGSS